MTGDFEQQLLQNICDICNLQDVDFDLIDAKALGYMKKSGILVNISRGDVVE